MEAALKASIALLQLHALKTLGSGYFGYSSFRPYQREIIQKVLDGRDCLVVMATGSGKSICYQIPPLVTKKTAVVVSPLLSLMQDQVMSLKQKGVKSEYLGSTQTNSSAFNEAEKGMLDVLYMTPEKAISLPSRFWNNLQAAGICLLAVDEAHCISEWGHDFRMEYKELHLLRDLLVGVPFVALTATATERVRRDISTSLVLCNPHVVVGSFDRHNLFYGVKSCNRSISFINELVKDVSKRSAVGESTIVYCTTIRETEQVHEALVTAGIKSGIYHGKMGSRAREESHRSFIRDEVRVMVATIAFGMGIDKPDVRCVIHYGCPKSLESYYQESGRCGRDGNCDNCTAVKNVRDLSKETFLLLSCIKSCGGHWGLNLPIDVLRGSRAKKIVDNNYDKLQMHGRGKDYSPNWWKALGGLLIAHDYLKETVRDTFRFVSVSPKGVKFLSAADKIDGTPLVLQLTAEMIDLEEHGSSQHKEGGGSNLVPTLESENFSEDESKLYQMLLNVRMELAQDIGTAPYAICGDQTIRSFAKMRPSTGARLANIDGVNQHFVSRFSGTFIQNITQLSKELNLPLDNSPLPPPPTINPAVENIAGVPKPVQNNLPGILGDAKVTAWELWQKQEFSFLKIAYFRRAVPIKEQTVIAYILDAAREGCELDWSRFCREVGLTPELASGIRLAIAKVGSRDKLKPIKEELPENVTYDMIKTFLTIEGRGLSEQIFSNAPASSHASEASGNDNPADGVTADACDANPSAKRGQTDGMVGSAEEPAMKLQKIEEHGVESSGTTSATEESVLELVASRDGVLLDDVVKHFNGSKRESVVEILDSLESEFEIYKKNGKYMIM
ncbi:hypothetical protein C2845_PM04G34160 [Panicum miliaceum]|uniref:DNA 3'-5' helicase n=1 Tax=Panicum miliaceum TaxID=4540 RepID=A0A3L6QWL5_PANMI|nr:hypothetical protein C2845_PM04G34160 [Panicum miliaceum]